jgi:hypothetical protein
MGRLRSEYEEMEAVTPAYIPPCRLQTRSRSIQEISGMCKGWACVHQLLQVSDKEVDNVERFVQEVQGASTIEPST